MKILVIPDTQVRHGDDITHIQAAGKYIMETKPDVIVVIGDWWDMPALSRFSTKMELEGQRIAKDLRAGTRALKEFLKPLRTYQRKTKKKDYYNPRLVFTVGNHDPQVRIPRLYEEFPTLEGLFTIPDPAELGFEVYDFLDVVTIEGIRFSHFFQNSHAAKRGPVGGMADTMLKNAGWSFVCGHTQGLKMAKHYLGDGSTRVGICAGSFYPHLENYMGRQGNHHWRGIVELDDVKDGGANISEKSLDWLVREYS